MDNRRLSGIKLLTAENAEIGTLRSQRKARNPSIFSCVGGVRFDQKRAEISVCGNGRK
jgi:hypothetical protein